MGRQRLAVQHTRVLQKLVVHLPKLSLPGRRLCRASGEGRPRVLPAKREMAENDAERALELVEQPNETWKCTSAVQTLEIGILHERDERRVGAADVVRVVYRRAEWWATE